MTDYYAQTATGYTGAIPHDPTPDPVIDSMIAWLDEHWGEDMHPSIAAEIRAEDPRTFREVYDAGLITDGDVIDYWLTSQAPKAGA